MSDDRYLQLMIAHNLVTYRQKRQLSRGDLADVLGVHLTYIGGLEHGEYNLTLRSVERFARRLNVPVLDLILGCGRSLDAPSEGACHD